MAYKKVSKEEFEDYLAKNPGGLYRINGQEQRAAYGDEDQGALMKILTSLSKPIRAVPASIFSAISGKEDEDNPFLTAREEQSFYEDPTKFGTKSAAGLASFLVPGGSSATTVGGRIAGAAAKGAGAGALSGFSVSEDEDELESILKGAGLGGLIGGGIQAGGEALQALKSAGLDKKLQQASDDLKVTAIKKKVGVAPTAKQGKYGLVKDVADTADEFGVKIKGPQDVASLSDEIFTRYGGLADEYAQAFDDAGNAINVNEIKQPLIDQLSKTKTPELQKPIQRVLNSIDEAAGGSSTIGAKDLLNLRREWGNLGNWNQFTPTNERMAAAVWEDAYSAANDVLEEALKKAGYNQFRDVNKLLKTGIEARNWAQRAEAYRRGSPVWNDMTQDALAMGAAGLGGGIGGAAGVAGSKVLQANAEDIASAGLGGLAGILRGTQPAAQAVGNMARPVGQAVQRVAPALAGQMGAQAQPQAQEQPQQQAQMGGLAEDEMNALNMYLANAVLQGQISASDANAVIDLLGLGGGGDRTKDQSKAVALQESLNKLRSAWEGTGGGGRVMETLGLNIGTNARSLDQAKEAVKEDLGRLQSQGAINKDEREAFEKMMPNAWDSSAVVQQKLQAIQDRINAYL